MSNAFAPSYIDSKQQSELSEYLAHFSAYRQLLTDEEVSRLGFVIQGDDSSDCEKEEAIWTLVLHNIRLVGSIVPGYSNRTTLSISDLMSVGMHGELNHVASGSTGGLRRAAELYDPTLGYKFSTYATHWVKQSLSRALENDSGAVRVPSYLHDRVRALAAAREAYIGEVGSIPTLQELVERLGWEWEECSYHTVAHALHVLQAKKSEPEEEALHLSGDVCEALALREEVESLETYMVQLASYQKNASEVLTRRFGLGGCLPATLEEIAGDLSLSRERIRQLEKTGLELLRFIRGKLGAPLTKREVRCARRVAIKGTERTGVYTRCQS